MTKLTEEKHALSYYYTDALGALTNLDKMLECVQGLWKAYHKTNASPSTFKEMSELGFDIILS